MRNTLLILLMSLLPVVAFAGVLCPRVTTEHNADTTDLKRFRGFHKWKNKTGQDLAIAIWRYLCDKETGLYHMNEVLDGPDPHTEFATVRYNRVGRKRAFEQAQKWVMDIVKLTDAVDRKLKAEEAERREKEAQKEAERNAQRERACEFVDGRSLIDFCTAGNRDAVAIVKRIQTMIAENRSRMGLED